MNTVKRSIIETIEERNNTGVFDQRVNDYLIAGWELHGPPTHTFLIVKVRIGDSALNYRDGTEIREIHAQTMVKHYEQSVENYEKGGRDEIAE